MKLSIVIVNYNVQHFLKLCLNSVFRALDSIPAEVLVVDNNSQDNSLEMVKSEFPQVKLIANSKNVGFSRANNQAIKIARGEFILLLNPDTVVEENTFRDCLKFMDKHPDGGALGIRMIDGKARYLPESKRGLPEPWVAFHKIFGLASLFPRSKIFARYYLGHLSAVENHEVEVLAGAFMLIRRKAIEDAGMLDEAFFMYGEDIDLSYRIKKAGYRNYYFADSRILHYKGESTKKGSLNYVYIFYKAMVIFAKKHFSGTYASLFSILINLAIYLRAGMSIFKRVATALALPLLDMGILLAGLWYIKEYWENNHRFVVGGEYSWELISFAFPLYSLAWIISIFLNSGYSRPTRIQRLIKGIFWGSIAIMVVYSMLSEEYRFSRAILLLGAMWALIAIPVSRLILQKLFGLKLITSTDRNKRALIVGDELEAKRVEQILKQAGTRLNYIAFAGVDSGTDPRIVAGFEEILPAVKALQIDEVVFCAGSLSFQKIFQKMEELKEHDPEIKIAPEGSDFVIGSSSIDQRGSWYGMDKYQINSDTNRRAKRAFDICTALLLLISFPLVVWFMPAKKRYLGNISQVLSGRRTWVSFAATSEERKLPYVKPGILTVNTGKNISAGNNRINHQLNLLYALNYSIYDDLNILFTNFQKLGHSS